MIRTSGHFPRPLASRTPCCRSRSTQSHDGVVRTTLPSAAPTLRWASAARRPATRPRTSSGSGRRVAVTPSTSSVADVAVPAAPRPSARPPAGGQSAPARLPNNQGTAHAPPRPAPPPRRPLVLALVAVLALAACSRRESRRSRRGGAAPSAAGTPAAELRLGYFPNITHAPALIGVDERLLPAGAGLHQAHHPDLQRRPRGGLRAARRLAGRRLHRLRPGHQRLRQEQRRGGPADRRLDLGRRAARGHARHHLARAAQGQDRSRRRRPATPRTSRSRSGSRRTTSPTARARTR